jgi:hypothetical protein
MEKIKEKLLNIIFNCACLPSIALWGVGIFLLYESLSMDDDLKNLSSFFKFGGAGMIFLGIIFMRNFIKIKNKEKSSEIKIEKYIFLFGGILSILIGIGSSIIATAHKGKVDYFFVGLGFLLTMLSVILSIVAIIKTIPKKR